MELLTSKDIGTEVDVWSVGGDNTNPFRGTVIEVSQTVTLRSMYGVEERTTVLDARRIVAVTRWREVSADG